METKWNDQEHRALRGLSMLAQLIYLRVFRRRMNYVTGISGGVGNRITMQSLVEECCFVPDPRSTKKAWIPTRGEIRAAIAELERQRALDEDPDEPVALMVDSGSNSDLGFIKTLLLATMDQSVKKMNNPRTAPEQPRKNNPHINSDLFDLSRCSETEQPDEKLPHLRRATPPPVNRRPEEEPGAKAPSCRAAKPSRFGEFWDAWPTGQRKRDRHKAERAWNRLRLDAQADMIVADVQRRAVEDQQWLRGYAPMPTTYLNGKRWEDEFGSFLVRIAPTKAPLVERNRAAIDAWMNAPGLEDNVIEGGFCREAK